MDANPFAINLETMKNMEETIKNLKADNEYLQKEIQELKRIRQATEDELNNYQTFYRNLHEEKEKLERRTDALEMNLEKWMQEVNNQQLTIDAQRKEIEMLKRAGQVSTAYNFFV